MVDPDQGSVVVLVVGDSAGFVGLLTAALQREATSVDVCRATETGGALAVVTDGEPDAVVCDHDAVDGVDLATDVRTTSPGLPFFLVAGAGSESLASEATAAGATGYVRKAYVEESDAVAARIVEEAQRFRRERRRGAERDRFATLVSNLPNPILEYEFDGEGEPVVRSVNPAFEDVFGSDADGSNGPPVRELLATADEGCDASGDEEPWAGEPVGGEVRLETADGPRDFLFQNVSLPDDRGADGYAIYVDITDRKQLDQRLRRERDRFSVLFDNLKEPAVEAVFPEDEPVLQSVNEAFGETFGVDPEAAIGMTTDDVIYPDGDVPEEAETLNQEASEGETLEIEVTRPTPDGPREFLLRSVPYQLGDGPQRGYAIYVDITDRKEYERELRRQNQRLETVASLITHDIRNPLNVARGSVDMLNDGADASYLEDVDESLERIERIIEDVLLLVKHGRTIGEPTRVDLAAVVADAWRAVETGEASLAIETDRAVMADRSRLQAVLENLVRNAVEHGSGVIDVPVSVRIGDQPDGFYVADDGPGIPEERRGDVFEPGYSTNEDGTGLGLDIVRSIVTAHGWTIAVTDAESGGAQFEITGVRSP